MSDAKQPQSASKPGLPEKQGLYDPANEHDNCGVGFIANVSRRTAMEKARDPWR